MWVWAKTPSVISDSTARARLMQFCLDNNIDHLFLDPGTSLTGAPAALTTFVRESSDRGITLEFLYGDPAWSRAANHAAPVGIAKRVVAFVGALPADIRPTVTGVHFDVEIYLLPEWQADRDAIGNQYLDMLQKLRSAVNGSGLELGVDVPRWWDQTTSAITRSGTLRPLSELTLDLVDSYGIMDYVNTGKRMVDDAANEVNYASMRAGKKIYVGAETLCGLDPASTSFCDSGASALEQALIQVDGAFNGKSGFRSVAVHHYESYRDLLERK